MKKAIIITLVSVVIVGGLVAALLLRPVDTTNRTARTSESNQQEPEPASAEDKPLAEGRYIAYDPGLVSAEGYDETILFFHASWCPECRAFEAAINEGGVPAGVQVLKVDYDSSTELRQKYEVTIQSSFVKVNDVGEKVSSWVGYGKDKSVDAILENT